MIPLSEDLSRILRRLWRFLAELPLLVAYDRRRSVQKRSLVRLVGTLLPLGPAPRVFFNLAAWNPQLEPHLTTFAHQESMDSSNYQGQINDLQAELKAIKDKLCLLLEKEPTVRLDQVTENRRRVVCKEKTSSDSTVTPPPPPPPPPMPPDISVTSGKPPHHVKNNQRRAPRYGQHQSNCDTLHLVLSQLTKGKPKLRHVERSPGGRPLKPKRSSPEFDPSDILTQVLKKRYSVMQESSDAESFNASFTEITSPIKSSAS